mmetsp:Transcript_3500/g.9479  ORF Transcript_3500/g.9479 Transcript_3500/m.9479 type:complete len:191 (+) Transcript_3500:83-655(+)|eukprot:CAMPEP_0119119664 /NCGR_PEP_ID=MMETSP1310-20130426/1057_1 /TAXON_ID=464262 /ORGANISM="Genus nov. species nov., Strain RCC2339" /LENGTH=190 /DNA_ID=CAMNT_0007109109 /DNA_START=51 /DNA_END=623 /DNA_ORIENTATION=+
MGRALCLVVVFVGVALVAGKAGDESRELIAPKGDSGMWERQVDDCGVCTIVGPWKVVVSGSSETSGTLNTNYVFGPNGDFVAKGALGVDGTDFACNFNAGGSYSFSNCQLLLTYDICNDPAFPVCDGFCEFVEQLFLDVTWSFSDGCSEALVCDTDSGLSCTTWSSPASFPLTPSLLLMSALSFVTLFHW